MPYLRQNNVDKPVDNAISLGRVLKIGEIGEILI
jgi:hypothetical protein